MGDADLGQRDLQAVARTTFETEVAVGLYGDETVKRIADLTNRSRHEVRDAARAMAQRLPQDPAPELARGTPVIVRGLGGVVYGRVLHRASREDLRLANIAIARWTRDWYLVATRPTQPPGVFLRDSLEVRYA